MHHFTLPPPAELAAKLPPVHASRSKQANIVAMLRGVILQHRDTRNQPFYSVRELANGLGVSLRTIQLTYDRLENEGLLISVRSSRTMMAGTRQPARVQVHSVVGLPLWLLGSRYFGQYKVFSRLLGDLLWRQHIVLDTIPYWEQEDRETQFFDRLLRHEIDFAVWLQPFRHNRETILKLRDHGIRNLLIADAELCPLPADIMVEWQPAYRKLLDYWRRKLAISRIVIVEGPPHVRARSRYFAEIARHAGFSCECRPMERSLPGTLVKESARAKPKGIVLVDEQTTVEMVFQDPASFIKLCQRDRFFFGRGMLNIPFGLPEGLFVERAVAHSESLSEQAVRIISAWRRGDIIPTPLRSEARCILEFPLQQNL